MLDDSVLYKCSIDINIGLSRYRDWDWGSWQTGSWPSWLPASDTQGRGFLQ